MGMGKKAAVGAAVATAAGYVTGILTAPKSGKETRKDIYTAAAKAKSEAEKKLKFLHSELSDLIDQGKARLASVKSTAKAELESALQLADNAKSKIRELLSIAHDSSVEDKDLQSAIKDASKAAEHLKDFLAKA